MSWVERSCHLQDFRKMGVKRILVCLAEGQVWGDDECVQNHTEIMSQRQADMTKADLRLDN